MEGGRKLSRGDLVASKTNGLGPGKAIGKSASGAVLVEYFDSVADGGRHTIEAPISDLRPFTLHRESRCYWDTNGGWRVGRVVHADDDYVIVRAPNAEDLRLPRRVIHVRWRQPIRDPTEVAIVGGLESPYFAERRRPFVRSMIEQRSATRGIPSLTSSVIGHYDHQVEVVGRVLEDPVQRYLLADEVGLGKTIEAGLIVRQYLLDTRGGKALIIVPPFLVPQWQAELEDKFLVCDFGEHRVQILPNDAPASWTEHLDAGILVVDEAHHIASLAGHADPILAHRYAALEQLARDIPRLMLLSATPVLNNEGKFLAMLHLLDPEVHRLEDEAAFKAKVANRQALGTLFYTFTERTPRFLLKEKAGALRGMFPADDRLASLLDELEAALAAATDSGVDRLVRGIRVHISETYRLHRRLLRTRRTKALTAAFPVPGRQPPRHIIDTDPCRRAVNAFIDEWRLVTPEQLAAGADREQPLDTLRELVERSSSDPAAVAEWAQLRTAHPTESQSPEAELVRSLQALLAEGGPAQDRVAQVVDLVLEFPASDKTVVFTSYTGVAEKLRRALLDVLAEPAVAAHIATCDSDTAEAELRRFRTDPACSILICDRSAEEGRNLQFADRLIHLDLPLAPNRLEQRIGRFDRFGSRQPVQSFVFVDPVADESYLTTWTNCLQHDFAVFSSSIATLQYAVDDVTPRLLNALLDEGIDGLREASARVPELLDAERARIEQQDVLDALEVMESHRGLAAELRQIEDNWRSHQAAADNLAALEEGSLRFRRDPDYPDARVVSYEIWAGGDRPDLLPLVPLDVLVEVFAPTLRRPGTYDRRLALAQPGLRLFRYGEPFIDALQRFVQWDDRGQTFAMWRYQPRWQGLDDLVAFRLEFVVEADIELAAALVRQQLGERGDSRIVQRRADGFFPPLIQTIWLDDGGSPIDDEAVLCLLEPPYTKPQRRGAPGDRNLSLRRRWALEQVLSLDTWAPACRRVRTAGERHLRSRLDLQHRCEQAADTAERVLAARIEQLRLRAVSRQSDREQADTKDELAREEQLAHLLVTGIRAPRVRLDSFGVIVLSNRLPEGLDASGGRS